MKSLKVLFMIMGILSSIAAYAYQFAHIPTDERFARSPAAVPVAKSSYAPEEIAVKKEIKKDKKFSYPHSNWKDNYQGWNAPKY